MFLTIFLFCLIGVPFIQCKQLHEYMTTDEVMSVFHTPHDLVPEYEIVPVKHRLAKNSDSEEGSEITLAAFRENLEMYLHPTEGMLASNNTPVWTVTSDPKSPEGMRYDQIRGATKLLGVAYQDVDGASAVLVSPTSNGQVHINGVIKNSYVIKSLPQRFLKEVAYGGHKLLEPHHTKNITKEDDFAYTHHHVVYKIPPLKGDQYKDFSISDPDDGIKHDAPEIIYPEVLVIVDHKLYKTLGENIRRAVKYIMAFWNGVDLRYRLLNTPRILFNIAGIVIAKDDDALPCLEKNRIELSMVDSDRALRCTADYLYRENRFPYDFYDMAVVMTRLDMCNFFNGPYCNPRTLGYAYVAGACDRNATKQSSEAVGIVEDNGGFSGIIPTAHEIGHLIGARHDGNPKGASDCEPRDGFIMTDKLLTHENGFEWSPCSINAFYTFIYEDRAKCLYNMPILGKPIARVLPGKLLSLDEQCYKVFGTPACNNDTTVCIRLKCEYPGYYDCKAVAAAAEGSPCGNNLICLNGKCVLEGALTKDQGKKLTEKQRKHLPHFKEQKIELIPWIKQRLGQRTDVGECTDVGSDCAELIDRLRTWLCHLQSVKSRCCAFLKTICVD
ncbi:venom metalloproteinase 3-like isoform X2 [Odontomachus brunneus]|nr:venom metalloproteinase 3-like isoform X2 [Odontomachus brunneus]XP_032668306.1 venom metalloproteinase 3-like isoform X2 [Odontomachus brunneus]